MADAPLENGHSADRTAGGTPTPVTVTPQDAPNLPEYPVEVCCSICGWVDHFANVEVGSAWATRHENAHQGLLRAKPDHPFRLVFADGRAPSPWDSCKDCLSFRGEHDV